MKTTAVEPDALARTRTRRLVGFAVEDSVGELLGRGGQGFLAGPDRLSGHSSGGRLVAWLFIWFIAGLCGNVFRFFVRICVIWGETVEVIVDGFEAAQHEATDVGEHGALAWRDASLGEQLVQGDQRVIDLLGALEVAAAVEEFGGEVGALLRLGGSMASAER